MPLKAKQIAPGYYQMEDQVIERHSADPKKKVNTWIVRGKQTRFRRLLDAMQLVAYDLYIAKLHSQEARPKLKKGHNPNQLKINF